MISYLGEPLRGAGTWVHNQPELLLSLFMQARDGLRFKSLICTPQGSGMLVCEEAEREGRVKYLEKTDMRTA